MIKIKNYFRRVAKTAFFVTVGLLLGYALLAIVLNTALSAVVMVVLWLLMVFIVAPLWIAITEKK